MLCFQYEAKTPGKRCLSLHQDGARKKVAPNPKPSPSLSAPVKPSPETHTGNKPDQAFVPTLTETETNTPEKTEVEEDVMVKLIDENGEVVAEGENTSESEEPIDSTASALETSHSSPSGTKKVSKKPLTAGAKKCFASVSILKSSFIFSFK